MKSSIRRPHSSYQRVVQGKCPLHFLNLNGAVCSNTLFSNTSALTSSLLFWGNSTCKILEHLVCSNTSGFQFWGPLARTNFLSALYGLPIVEPQQQFERLLALRLESCDLKSLRTGGDSNRCKPRTPRFKTSKVSPNLANWLPDQITSQTRNSRGHKRPH